MRSKKFPVRRSKNTEPTIKNTYGRLEKRTANYVDVPEGPVIVDAEYTEIVENKKKKYYEDMVRGCIIFAIAVAIMVTGFYMIMVPYNDNTTKMAIKQYDELLKTTKQLDEDKQVLLRMLRKDF